MGIKEADKMVNQELDGIEKEICKLYYMKKTKGCSASLDRLYRKREIP